MVSESSRCRSFATWTLEPREALPLLSYPKYSGRKKPLTLSMTRKCKATSCESAKQDHCPTTATPARLAAHALRKNALPKESQSDRVRPGIFLAGINYLVASAGEVLQLASPFDPG